MPTNFKDRRKFLRVAAQGLAMTAVASRWPGDLWASPLGLPIGTQLGWLKNDCSQDLDGTLKQLAEMGYGDIEGPLTPFPSKYYNRTPAEFRRLLDAHGLKCRSSWILPESDKAKWEQQVEGARRLGLRYLVVDKEPDSLDEYKQVAALWNKLGSSAAGGASLGCP